MPQNKGETRQAWKNRTAQAFNEASEVWFSVIQQDSPEEQDVQDAKAAVGLAWRDMDEAWAIPG